MIFKVSSNLGTTNKEVKSAALRYNFVLWMRVFSEHQFSHLHNGINLSYLIGLM